MKCNSPLCQFLPREVSKGRLTGWLKNSQVFIGVDDVVVTPNMTTVGAACRK